MEHLLGKEREEDSSMQDISHVDFLSNVNAITIPLVNYRSRSKKHGYHNETIGWQTVNVSLHKGVVETLPRQSPSAFS